MTSFFLCTIIIGLVSIFGIAINGYIIFVIIKEKQVRSVNGMLLVQHSAVELALSVCVIVCSLAPIVFDNAHQEAQRSSNTYCNVCGFLMSFLRPVALWTVCALNCDRYYAISAPLHYGSLINSRKVLIAMSVTWLSSLILSLPIVIVSTPFKYSNDAFFCTPTSGMTFALYYSVVYITLVFILPLFLILVCNAKVFTIARHHKHRIASAIFEVTLSAQVTITHQKNPFSPSGLANRFKGRSASLTVFQIVGSFVIIYVPYYSTMLWNSISSLLSQPSAQQITMHQLPSTINHSLPASVISTASILLFCSSSVNGLLYGVKNKVLKKCFSNYWRKKMTKNELNQEIQARTPSTCGSRRPSLTPAVGITFFTRQSGRRTSDISVDTQKSNLLGTSFSRFQYNNLTWRPGSSPGLETSVAHNDSFNELKRTHSLRRSISNHMDNSLSNLRLPANPTATPPNGATDMGRIEEPPGRPFNNLYKPVPSVKNGKPSVLIGGSGATLLLQRFRKTDPCDYEVLNHRRRSKSPKILITRAYSEENDSTNADRSCPPKTSSSVTTLLIDSHNDSASKDCVSFGVVSRHPLLMDNTTDDSGSDESQSHSNDELCAMTKNGDPSARLSANNLKSWPFGGGRRKNIQFRIGSVVLSERDFMSNNCDNTNNAS